MIEVTKKRKLDVFTKHFIESMNPMNLSTEYLRSTIHWGYSHVVNCVSGAYSPVKGRDNFNNLPKQQELNTGLDFILSEHRGRDNALCLGLRKPSPRKRY